MNEKLIKWNELMLQNKSMCERIYNFANKSNSKIIFTVCRDEKNKLNVYSEIELKELKHLLHHTLQQLEQGNPIQLI